jgi:putative cardiolipin synthase
MHNKLLVADDKHAIFGGRNIAAEHFGLGDKFNLVDDDVLLSGSEVPGLSTVFEEYWNSPTSMPGAELNEKVGDHDLAATRDFIAHELNTRMPALSGVLNEESAWPQRAASMTIPLQTDALDIVADSPGFSHGDRPTQVIEMLHRAVNAAERDLVVITAFFVPDEIDVDWYRSLVDRGVRIRLLTNSLASNMGTISNSWLTKVRLPLVKAGVELYELRTDATAKPDWEIPPRVARYLGLHAKMYAIDQERVFLGSLNLDPRSKKINTEIGALINNPALAGEIADAIERLMTPQNAWSVEIGPNDQLEWRSDRGTLRRQPARNGGQRLADAVFGLAPIRPYI